MEVGFEAKNGKSWLTLVVLLCLAASVRAGSGATSIADFNGIVHSTSGGFQFPDGTVLASAATIYANLVVVAQSGGQFSSVQAALDSITDASPTNQYLVWVAPGTYSEQVTMKPFVDIQGAGELVTKITHGGFAGFVNATLIGSDDAEVRFLTVENTGGAFYARAIFNNGTSPRITHVTAGAQGGTSNTAIRNVGGAAPVLTHVRAIAATGDEAHGIYSAFSDLELTHVEASATFALMLNAGLVINGGSALLNGVAATGSLGAQAVGIRNWEGSLQGSDIRATALGGTESYALDNREASLSIRGGSFRAQGGTAIALLNEDGPTGPSSARLQGVRLVANGTGTSRALENRDSTATIQRSLLQGEDGSSSAAVAVLGPGISTVQIADSQVLGASIGPPPEITCVGAYDENLVTLDADCN